VEVLKQGEVIQALLGARKGGKIRFIGYSGGGEAARWAIESGEFDTLQIPQEVVEELHHRFSQVEWS
jgi:hypothetical protein